MSSTIALGALIIAAFNAAVAAFGGLRWWRVEPSRAFWPLLRGAQVASALYAGACGAVALAGRTPEDGLFWLYVLLPLAVAFVGEQLRILSAQTVLDARDLPDARAVGTLPEAEQRSVVLQIVRRELGVMAISAAVAAFLLVRAAATAHGFA